MDNPSFSLAISLLLVLALAQVKSYNSPGCPQIYRRFSTMHSYCQPKNQSCNILRSMLTKNEVTLTLNLHNHFRSVVATQTEKVSSNRLPPAGDMLYMEYDNELAKVAQQYADQCIYAHDLPSQRRVKNFGVGQNIAMQKVTGYNLKPPTPDWNFAVTAWFEEISVFNSDEVCNFPQPAPGQMEYRHFSQLVWAKSFRVGCGYTMFKEGNSPASYTRLYICNYGPTGNIYGTCVYEKGPACSKCPINTQCTDNNSQYPGLCKRYNNKAPYQPVQQPYLFHCNFMNPGKEDCLVYLDGATNWLIIPALGGNYLEIVLQPGQNTTLTFDKQFKGNAKKMCVRLLYRKGPNLAMNPQNNKATETFIIPSLNHYTYAQNLPSYTGEAQVQFSTYYLTLSWYQSTVMKISFEVPYGAAPQYFNVDSVLVVNNDCKSSFPK